MNATINSTPNAYGFGHDWQLVVETKNGVRTFYLGQDVKFIRRVLNVEPMQLIAHLGDNDLRNPLTMQKLAHFIIMKLGLNETEIEGLESWELCCQ